MEKETGLIEIELNHTKTLLKSCEKALSDRDEEAQKLYSEEEVINLLENYDREFKIETFAYTKPCTFTVKEWFEKFKKQ